MFRDQQKNYFYRMKITSPDGNQSAELTPEVLRLITGVTISESSYSDDSQTYPTLSFTLNETSYLPEDDSFNTTNPRIRGQLTNRPGSILDIRFDSEKGFTYVSKEELESGRTRSSRTQSNTDQPVVFLFGGNNKVEIEWGLLEPKVSRKRIFTITTISVQGGGSGHGTVTITALDGMQLAEKTTLSQGKVFANPTNNKPNSLKQVLFQVTRVLDYDLEFDGQAVTAFPPLTETYVPVRTGVGGDTAPPDPKNPITLTRHMNLHEFVKELANQYSSAYEYDTDPKTGRTKLIFTPRNVKYGKTDYTFTYKDPKGGMLSYKIDSVEGQFNPVASASNSADGTSTEATTFSEQLVVNNNQTTTEESTTEVQNETPKVPASKDSKILARINEAIPGLFSVGTGITHPSRSPDALEQSAKSTYDRTKFLSTITVTHLGNPNYRPGLAKLNNIGLRYSTYYRMFTVQHSLSNSGYICTFNGKSQFLAEGGTDAGEAAKENATEQVRLVQPAPQG
jgi:hypothetical protein